MRTILSVLALCALVQPAGADSGLIFDHALHVDDMGLDCEDCHGGVAESVNLLERYRAEKSACGDCHDLGDVDDCGTCHIDADDPAGHAEAPVGVNLFSHAAHVGDMECAACHGGAPEHSGAPAKSDCRSCHQTVANFEDCGLCHSAGQRHIPETHQSDNWANWHGIRAGSNTDDCMLCHVQDSCQQCHAGDNVRPRSHPLNYEFNHSVDARVNRIECEVCHTEPSYCEECHSGFGIIPLNHAEPGWSSGLVHGPEALFDIQSCIACHDAGEAVPATCAGSGCHGGS